MRTNIRKIAPYLGERVNELHAWEQIKILTVQINRLKRWFSSGLLCIGDAAHAMSPAGGVGINLAIQDAVATANILTEPLQNGSVSESHLALVQRRREFPTRLTQAVQQLAHRGFVRVFETPGNICAPWQMKVATRIPGIHAALGYAVGIGACPEHVREKRRPEARRFIARNAVLTGIGIVATLTACWAAWRTRPRTI